MSIPFLSDDMPLPPPETAGEGSLVAIGGGLCAARLNEAYRTGIFPWYQEGQPVLWHCPETRMVLPTEALVVNRSLQKSMRRQHFQLTMDTAFESVIRACAAAPREGQDGTWITDDMIEAYVELHQQGDAHSVEAWRDGELVGGLYGVGVGAMFCGESMFAKESDASKVAFVAFVRQLQRWGVRLVDCQVYTEHLERFGAFEITRADFLQALRVLKDRQVTPQTWSFVDMPEPT